MAEIRPRTSGAVEALVAAREDIKRIGFNPSSLRELISTHHFPFKYINVGQDSIVIARGKDHVITLFRGNIEEARLRRLELTSEILHVLLPEHFPQVRFFETVININGQEELVHGTVRRYVHGRKNDKGDDYYLDALNDKLKRLKTLGLVISRLDGGGDNFRIEDNNAVYVDLARCYIYDKDGIEDRIKKFMRESGRQYTQSQYTQVKGAIEQLKILIL